MSIAKRCLVSGRVQGVFYRASTQQLARTLGIAGYAKNLPDGCVEVLAIGEAAQVDALVQWLRQGPPTARVTDLSIAAVEIAQLGALPSDFTTT